MNVWYLNRIGGMGDWRESAKQGLFAILRTLPLSGRQEVYGGVSRELVVACPLEGLVRRYGCF